MGDGPWLLCRKPAAGGAPGVRMLLLDAPELAPFRTALDAWLDKQEVAAVLVRPDRYVFGAGEPDQLLLGWTRHLSGLSQAA